MASRTGDKLADSILDEYETELQLSVARALDGKITQRQLSLSLQELADKYLGMLYTIGGGSLTSAAGKRWQEKEKRIHKTSSEKLAADIFAGKYNATTD
jgi:hypothetical protein